MSRCFPFPPPGYEKKPRPDDDDILKKEKLKEKKHKEKKDREKKEGKEKREKERSDGKHREKKDRKEKHKDKRKDNEDGEKDREKGIITEEKRVSGQLEDYNGAKLHQREKERGKEICSTSADRRQTRKYEGCNGEKLHNRVEQSRDKRNISDEKIPVVQFQGHSGGKTFQNSLLDKDSEDSKFVLELDRRVRDEGKGTGNQLVEGLMGMDRKKDEGIERFAVRGTIMAVESKEKNKDKRVDNRKMDGQRTGYDANFSGNAMAHNLAGSIQNKVGVPKPMEKVDQRMEGKEKEKEREVEDIQGDTCKSRDKETQSQGKDKQREKEKKKEDKAKEKKEHRKSEKAKNKSSNKSDLNGAFHKTSHLSKDGYKNAAMEDNLKKRKDMEKNGFLHDDTFRPEKMPKLTSHSLPENGKKLEPSQTCTPFSPSRQGTAYNLKVDGKDHKINGLIGAQKLPISSPKPSTVIAEQIVEASRRSPHPDTKYLSKVVSVPQMDEWSGFDDQEWLFDSKSSLLKKSEVGSVRVNPEQRVWAEALQMELADVYALPYVIPY